MEIPRHWRLKDIRYRLQPDLSKTQGVPSINQRPVPLGGGVSERNFAIDKNYLDLQLELEKIKANILTAQRVEEIVQDPQKRASLSDYESIPTVVVFPDLVSR